MNKGFDVASIDLDAAASEGADCVLRHPVTGDELDATIRVVGMDSETYRKARRKMVDAMVKDQRGRRPKSVTDEEAEQRRAEAVAAITVSWSGLQWEGKPLDCTFENAVMVYTKRPWVLEQVEGFAEDRANFLAV